MDRHCLAIVPMSPVVNLHRIPTVLVVALFVSGCSGPTPQPTATTTATIGADEVACRAAIRDMRTWCVGGLREANAEQRYNCLEARLRFDQGCYPQ